MTACVTNSKQEAVLKATAVRSPLPVISVMSSILPCPPCLPQVMQTQILFHQCKSNRGGGSRLGEGVQAGRSRPGGGGPGQGEGGGGKGRFHPPCHILHYHMVLALKGLRTITHRLLLRILESLCRNHDFTAISCGGGHFGFHLECQALSESKRAFQFILVIVRQR